MMLHQLAKSHAENLIQKVEALKLQGQSIIGSSTGGNMPMITVVGSVCGEKVNEFFILDNMTSINRCAEFTKQLSTLSKSLPIPMGRSLALRGVA